MKNLYLVISDDRGAYTLSNTWPRTKTQAFKEGVLTFGGVVTLFRSRLEANRASQRTRRYADRFYPMWHSWLSTSRIVRARAV